MFVFVASIVLFAAGVVSAAGVFLAAGAAVAQQPQGMPSDEMMRKLQDPEAMQRVVAQMQEVQKCMERIDQKDLDALKARAEAASKEIEALCKAGEKDRALARAMELGEEMRSDATVKQVRECTRDMGEMIQGMPMGSVPGVTDDAEPTASDVCS